MDLPLKKQIRIKRRLLIHFSVIILTKRQSFVKLDTCVYKKDLFLFVGKYSQVPMHFYFVYSFLGKCKEVFHYLIIMTFLIVDYVSLFLVIIRRMSRK